MSIFEFSSPIGVFLISIVFVASEGSWDMWAFSSPIGVSLISILSLESLMDSGL